MSPRPAARIPAELAADLPLAAIVQVPMLVVHVAVAKALAARQAFPDWPLPSFPGLVLKLLPQDLLGLALLTVGILLARRFAAPGRVRILLLALILTASGLLALFHYANAGFFMYFGAPLSRDLLLLAPSLLGYSGNVVSLSDPMFRLIALSLVIPPVLTPILWRRLGPTLVRDARSWRNPAWVGAAALAALGIMLTATPVSRYREVSLRNLSMGSLLLPARRALDAGAPELTPRQRDLVQGLLGGPQGSPAAAFRALPRRHLNVVLWIWESVGERFLGSHHPLGRASTPTLDRLKALGSVRFSNAYVECPLSPQSDWAIMTGSSPPANPRVFKTTDPLPEHPPLLAAVLKGQGYHTAFVSSSYLRSWGETRFLSEGGLDVLEDADSLANRAAYTRKGWTIEGRAIVERFFLWTDGLPRNEPFFALLWNLETHHPYTWIGITPELARRPDLDRYLAGITHSDELLGQFYDGLVARGLQDDTLVVVVGDHGQGMGRGDRPYDRLHSLLVSEDVLHVPLVFLHPSLPAGGRVLDTPVTLTDIYPTLLDLFGIDPPPGGDGFSLAREYQPRMLVARTITWWPMAARAGRFKLVQDRREDPPELYDIAADGWETDDISNRHRDVTEALLSQLRWSTGKRAREDPSFALFTANDWVIPY